MSVHLPAQWDNYFNNLVENKTDLLNFLSFELLQHIGRITLFVNLHVSIDFEVAVESPHKSSLIFTHSASCSRHNNM